jgi:outer membrane protein insertion porin family
MRLTKLALVTLVSSSSLLVKPAWSETMTPPLKTAPEVTQSSTAQTPARPTEMSVYAKIVPTESISSQSPEQIKIPAEIAQATQITQVSTKTPLNLKTKSSDVNIQQFQPLSDSAELVTVVKTKAQTDLQPVKKTSRQLKIAQTTSNPSKTTRVKVAQATPKTPLKTPPKTAAKKTPIQPKTTQAPTAPAKPSDTPVPEKPSTTPASPTESTTTTPTAPTPNTPNLDITPTPATPPEPPTTTSEAQVLVGEVLITTSDGKPIPAEIEKQAYDAIVTKPGRTTSRTQLQADINSIYSTGYFGNVKGDLQDTELGVRVAFVVEVNPVLKSVQTEGASVLEAGTIDKIFGPQYGKVTNLRDLQAGVKELEKYYQDKGYVLAQVADVKSQPDGTVTIIVAEGVVEDIKVGFLNEEGKDKNTDGTPVRGNTRDFIVTRELSLKPGNVFNRNTVQSDLQRVFGLGIFDDVNVGLNPGTDPKKVVVTVNVKERSTGSIAVGAGISSATGLFGTVSFQQANLGGNNQKLGLDVQVGERDLLFDLNFTDPWLAGDPYRTSFTANIFNRRLFSYIFDNPPGAPADIGIGPDKTDTPRENRLGLGFTFSRPLSSTTTASLGFRYEHVTITDSGNTITPFDGRGNQLAINPNGQDDLFLLQFAVAQDLRDDPIKTTKGSVFRLVTEQSIPIGNGSIFFNRLRASYSFYIPVKFTSFNEGPQTLAFNLQAGTILGTMPPYEAFRIGGSNSVRGWDEGRIGSGRSYALVSAEYRFPVFSIVNGVLFADYGTDLGTGASVPGNPAGVRNKPGNGGGYGVGVRIQSPLGAIRIDYGFATNGGTQFSFGLGEKF